MKDQQKSRKLTHSVMRAFIRESVIGRSVQSLVDGEDIPRS
jgi:hypothetical protein